MMNSIVRIGILTTALLWGAGCASSCQDATTGEPKESATDAQAEVAVPKPSTPTVETGSLPKKMTTESYIGRARARMADKDVTKELDRLEREVEKLERQVSRDKELLERKKKSGNAN